MGEKITPALSVIIPVFNGARTISQSLKSLEAQTLTDWDAVVVDDGSTDSFATYDIARAFGERDPRILVVRIPWNCGAAVAANWGMRRATGKYWAVLAADDYWLDDFAEKAVAALEANSMAPGAYSDVIEWDEAAGLKRVRRLPDFDRGKLLERDFVNYSALVFRFVARFDPDWNPAADWDSVIRMTKYFPLIHLRETLAVYRVHSGSTSARRRAKHIFLSLLIPYRYGGLRIGTRAAIKRIWGLAWAIRRGTFKY